MVFSNKRASRAILLPTAGDSKEVASHAAINRVKQIADRLREALRLTNGFVQRDPSKNLEGGIHLTAGMVSCRLREFQIDFDFDFDGRLKLQKHVKDVIKPVCAAMIEKGSSLTEIETQAVVSVHVQKLRKELSV
jgi:hypothetical protein